MVKEVALKRLSPLEIVKLLPGDQKFFLPEASGPGHIEVLSPSFRALLNDTSIVDFRATEFLLIF